MRAERGEGMGGRPRRRSAHQATALMSTANRTSWLSQITQHGAIALVLGPAIGQSEPHGRGSGGLGRGAEHAKSADPLDLHTGCSTSKTPEALPVNLRLSAH